MQHADIHVASNVEVLQEFKNLKMHNGPKLKADEICLSVSEFWPKVYAADGAKYRNLLLLVELILCIHVPFSTTITLLWNEDFHPFVVSSQLASKSKSSIGF